MHDGLSPVVANADELIHKLQMGIEIVEMSFAMHAWSAHQYLGGKD